MLGRQQVCYSNVKAEVRTIDNEQLNARHLLLLYVIYERGWTGIVGGRKERLSSRKKNHLFTLFFLAASIISKSIFSLILLGCHSLTTIKRTVMNRCVAHNLEMLFVPVQKIRIFLNMYLDFWAILDPFFPNCVLALFWKASTQYWRTPVQVSALRKNACRLRQTGLAMSLLNLNM